VNDSVTKDRPIAFAPPPERFAATGEGDRLRGEAFPESRLAGFSHVDGTVGFYNQIAALLRPDSVVLEFGAGRGANIGMDPSPYRRAIQTLKGRCARVAGCDVDPVVLQNPFLDDAQVIRIGAPLPYADATFDLIVSSWVFEHVDNAQEVADELLRILKPGGTICASTPNKYGYVALASRLVRNAAHAKMLGRIQPEREAADIFPTRYQMNTISALRRLFGRSAEVLVYRTSADPSYHFNNRLIYRLFVAAHGLLPNALATTLYIFIRKQAQD